MTVGRVDPAAQHALSCGLHVRSAEASLGFYRDLIGCEVVGRLRLPQGDLWALTFGDAMIKLLEWDAVPDATNPPGVAIGLRYLTFHVANPDELFAACVAAGLSGVKPPYAFSPTVRNAIVLDPDGNVFELCHGEAWEPLNERLAQRADGGSEPRT